MSVLLHFLIRLQHSLCFFKLLSSTGPRDPPALPGEAALQGGSDPSLEEVGGAQGQSSRGTARRGNVSWGTRGQARSLRVCGRDFVCRTFVIPYPRQVGCGKIRKAAGLKKRFSPWNLLNSMVGGYLAPGVGWGARLELLVSGRVG